MGLLKAKFDWKLERSPRAALALCIALVIILGFVDYAHAPDFSVALFYGGPIAIAARYINRKTAIGLALFAIMTWFTADVILADARQYSSALAICWNLAERLVGFVAAAIVISRLEDNVLHEHRKDLEEHRISLAKSDVLSVVSHQFANALTVMGLAVGFLEQPPENADADQRQELYRTLKQNVRVLTLIAQNFLNQARLKSGHFALELERVSIGELLKVVLATLQPLSEQKKISIVCAVPAGDLTVMADPEALNVVLTNLVGNAIKYTGAGGKIVIGVGSTGLPDGHYLVSVEDTGMGITKKDQQRILTGFTRTATGKKAAAGFGLGLKVAHDLLKSHGSLLMIESEPGRGSRFSFMLPTHKDATTSFELFPRDAALRA